MNKNSQLSDFNLFLSSDALLGVLEAMHEMMAEMPTDGTEARTLWLNSLTGLAWMGRNVAREMNVFLYKASDCHRFPNTYADIESSFDGVKETATVYAIR